MAFVYIAPAVEAEFDDEVRVRIRVGGRFS